MFCQSTERLKDVPEKIKKKYNIIKLQGRAKASFIYFAQRKIPGFVLPNENQMQKKKEMNFVAIKVKKKKNTKHF